MNAPLKHDYIALSTEYDQRRDTKEKPASIKADFEARGVNWGTFKNKRSQANKAHPSTPTAHQDTPEEHQSTPEAPELLTVHPGTPEPTEILSDEQYTHTYWETPEQSGVPENTYSHEAHQSTPEHLSTPESTEISPDEQYTEEHLSTLQDADPTEVHHGTLEGHQEVMEDISQSVPDAPHIGTEEPYQSIPEHPSTPEVHPELSPSRSGVVHPGVPARQDHLISTPMVHPGTPSEEDWELWNTIKAMWPRVEKILSDQQVLLSTPMGTPRQTQKKTYVFDVQHIALIDEYARVHRMELKDVIYLMCEEFFQRR